MLRLHGEILTYIREIARNSDMLSFKISPKSDFYHPPKPEDCHDDMEPPVKADAHGSYPVPKPGFTKMI